MYSLPEGHHEQYRGHKGDTGAPRGPHDSRPLARTQQAPGNVRGGETTRRRLPHIQRQPQKSSRRYNNERRVQRQGQVPAHRSGLDEQAE